VKPSSSDGTGDPDNDGNPAGAAAATATAGQPPQPAANPTQPVATALILNTSAGAAPTVPNASDAAGALATSGEPTKGRASFALTSAAGQNPPSAQDTTDATSAKPTASATEADANLKTALEAGKESAKSEKANSNNSPPQQIRTQPADDTQGTPPTDISSAPADAARSGTQSLGSSTISATAAAASNAQGADAATKTGADGLPNFGFSASVASASSTATDPAPSGAASAAAVPITGLAIAIAARAQAGSQQFDIRLDPPELGRIDVRLAVDGSGQVTTHMTTERADTLQLLQSQQPQLERALEQAGLKTADNGLQFTLRDQSFTGQNNGSNPQPSSTAQVVIPDPELAPVTATQIYGRAGLGGGVDIRV
jgi:flagellar hook-length control protein FliK